MLFIDLTDDSSNDGNVFDSVYVYKYGYTCLCISEINESKGDKDGREELGIFCYYKVLVLPVQQ